MDNMQIPPVQPVTPISPSGGMPPNGMSAGMAGTGNPMGAMGSGAMPNGMVTGPTPNGLPMVQQIQLPPEQKKDIAGLVKTIVIVILAIVAVVFIGLFVWKMIDYSDLQANWETDKDMAVAQAEDAVRMEEAEKYNEEKKYPYETFTGPVDYGELSFEYPKTWSVYVAQAAAGSKGTFEAYLNPLLVDSPSDKNSLFATRVKIETRSFDEVVAEYQRQVDDKKVDFDVQTVEIVNEKTEQKFTANRYEGVIPNTEFTGYIIVFKIRDKTVTLQTDSQLVFGEEFDKLLKTIQFNE